MGSKYKKAMFEQYGEFNTETLLFKTWDRCKRDESGIGGHDVQFNSLRDFRKAQLTEDEII